MKRYGLYIAVLIAVLPIIILRDYTPDNELRYLSIADEALSNGNIFAFYNQGIPYADKPPLYIWIVMLGKLIFSTHRMWFLSLFSLIPAFVITDIMDRWTADEIRPRYRLAARLMMLSCGLFIGVGLVLRMDMLMCMFIVLALHSFLKMHHSGKYSLLFPIYVFMAVFSKGPVGILVPLLCTIIFLIINKDARAIGRYWGWKTWGVLLVLCALWFGAAYAEGGYAYIDNLLFHQTIDRAVNSFHHEEPFWYYLVSVWYSLMPWAFAVIGMIIFAAVKRQVTSETERFFLTVIVTTFVMLSVISSKIAVYLAPTFPFFIYLGAIYLFRTEWNKWKALSLCIPFAVFALSLPIIMILSGRPDTAFLSQTGFYIAAGILSAAGIIALFRLYKNKDMNSAITTLAAGLFAAIFAGGWSVPKINSEIGYGALCRTASMAAEENGTEGFCVWKISRPENMDVYLGQDIRKVTKEDITSGTLKNTILMLPAKRTGEIAGPLTDNCKRYDIGRYSIIVLQN